MEPTKFLVVEVDTNDADYDSQTTKITDEQLTRFKPLFEGIKNFHPYKAMDNQKWSDHHMEFIHNHNWPMGEAQREDLGEKSPREIYSGVVDEKTFLDFEEDFIPYPEYGFHTIESIKVITVVNEEKLL